MNADSFADLLANPFRLHQLSYHELRSLVLDYPWCQSLRMLLALKSKMDGREDQQSDLEMAAAYAPDRDYWYQQVVTGLSFESLADGIVMQEDYLELKDLTNLEPEAKQQDSNSDSTDSDQSVSIESQASSAPMALNSANEIQGGGESPVSSTTAPPDEDQLDTLFEEVEQEMQPDPESSIEWADNPVDTPLLFMLEGAEDGPSLRPSVFQAVQAAVSISGIIELRSRQVVVQSTDEPFELSALEPERVAAPQPKSSFHSWLRQFASPHPLQDWREEPVHAAETSRAADEHAEKAEKSVTENDELATETLAALLERQGQYEKAIEIYERLSLKFPKKSAFFAEKIQQLKNGR